MNFRRTARGSTTPPRDVKARPGGQGKGRTGRPHLLSPGVGSAPSHATPPQPSHERPAPGRAARPLPYQPDESEGFRDRPRGRPEPGPASRRGSVLRWRTAGAIRHPDPRGHLPPPVLDAALQPIPEGEPPLDGWQGQFRSGRFSRAVPVLALAAVLTAVTLVGWAFQRSTDRPAVTWDDPRRTPTTQPSTSAGAPVERATAGLPPDVAAGGAVPAPPPAPVAPGAVAQGSEAVTPPAEGTALPPGGTTVDERGAGSSAPPGVAGVPQIPLDPGPGPQPSPVPDPTDDPLPPPDPPPATESPSPAPSPEPSPSPSVVPPEPPPAPPPPSPPVTPGVEPHPSPRRGSGVLVPSSVPSADPAPAAEQGPMPESVPELPAPEPSPTL